MKFVGKQRTSIEKLSSKDYSEVSRKLTRRRVNTARKTILQNCKLEKFSQQLLASLKNNQSFHSIADYFVRFTTISERKVSLQDEKSNVSHRRIGR